MIFSRNTLWLEFFIIVVFYGLLLHTLSDWILQIHQVDEFSYFLPDSHTYFRHYVDFIENYDLTSEEGKDRFLALAFNKSPVALLILFSGDIVKSLAFSGVLALLSLAFFLRVLPTIYMRRFCVLFCFFIPYFVAGFFSIGKEIFISSSCLLFLTFLYTGKLRYFLFAIVVAFFGRILFIPVLFMAFWLVYFYKCKILLIVMLVVMSSLVPFLSISIPGAPDFLLHRDAGFLSKLFVYIKSMGGILWLILLSIFH